MSGQHTSGPWYFDGDWYRLPTVFGAGGKRVAILEKTGVGRNGHTVAQEADARLIAAAPDLLAALIGLMPVAEYEHMTDDDLREEARLGNGAAEPILAARAAIAKARPA